MVTRAAAYHTGVVLRIFDYQSTIPRLLGKVKGCLEPSLYDVRLPCRNQLDLQSNEEVLNGCGD